MKKLLMIIPFFPPNAGGGVYRPLGFVKYLERFGWQPTVVTARAESFWITDQSLLGDVPDSVSVHRTSTLSGQSLLSKLRRSEGRASQVRSSHGFGALRRFGAAALMPDTYIGWYPFARREAVRLATQHRFDAVYSTSPPETAHLVGQSVSRATGLPWVADFRDPWMNLHLLSPPTGLHRRMHQKMEKRVCERAHLIVTTRWHHDLIRQTYPAAPSVTVVRNGFDRDKMDAVGETALPEDRLQITHAGMLTQKRSAAPFLEALHRFLLQVPEARTRVRATFIGPRESANDEHVLRLGLGDVVAFEDTLPHAESLRLQKRSHILLLIKHLNPDYQGLIPGKLFEYIGARRPVFAMVPEGEVADIVREHRRGEVVPLDDVDAAASIIADMYQRFCAGTLEDSYDLSETDRFTREASAGELAQRLNAIVDGEVS